MLSYLLLRLLPQTFIFTVHSLKQKVLEYKYLVAIFTVSDTNVNTLIFFNSEKQLRKYLSNKHF
jgi:hypothetical protein